MGNTNQVLPWSKAQKAESKIFFRFEDFLRIHYRDLCRLKVPWEPSRVRRGP